MNLRRIPGQLDALTPAWVENVLRQGGTLQNSKIQHLSVEPITEGYGFLGETARLRLDYARPDPLAPPSLIVKLPTANPKLRSIGESMGVYEREIRFYTELAPRLSVSLPHCYAALANAWGAPQMNPTMVAWINRMPHWIHSGAIAVGPSLTRVWPSRYALVLEDLGRARLGNQVGSTSDRDIHSALASLAQIHAECWNDPTVNRLPWLHSLDSTARIFGSLLSRQRPRFEAIFANSLPEGAGTALDWLEANLPAVHQRLARPPCTLIHGDYRLDNLFFNDSQSSPRAIVTDWQVSAWGRGTCDLAYLLSSALDPDVSQQTELAYVARYHSLLLKFGVSNYGLDECTSDYRLGLLFAVGRVVSSIGELEATHHRARALVRLWIERLFFRLQGIDLEQALSSP